MSAPTSDQRRLLTAPDVAAAGLADWRHLRSELVARFATADFATGLALVARVGAAAEAADHHPDVVLTYGSVTVRLTSHDVGGLTSRDVDLARAVSALAAEVGARSDPSHLGAVELGLDTARGPEQARFWAAVLGAQVERDEVVGSPRGLPDVWFQAPDPAHDPQPGEPPQAWHPDVWVDPADAEARVQAALDAGGSLVSDADAPAYWVLADPEGNRVCVCTPQGRG
ncbi:4a-hydroxytetrahydrobiopterin dehydratase [Nocardioides perillae]|uniref:Putative pterin-4-alpha-carbinolamine dehydratase n=1 Tax=Nocardioides perillae TaxID=1119534 RepID=A0A7Y9RTR9_9ACTN|nr:4a-hydroxytetrahydrobiopterin dehydratase [Nocardioides perillae]